MFKTLLLIAAATFATIAGLAQQTQNSLITLSNDTIAISILPEVGGRLVRASLCGKPNILKSDSTQWNESPDKRPGLTPRGMFKAYNGHITWLSPQSEWWAHQDSFPLLKSNHAQWPPDTYLEFSPFRIVRQTSHEIVLTGPASPFSKMQLTKTFRISGNKVFVSAAAKNTSTDTVSWGLWHNTRMSGWDAVFVQANETDLRKTNYMRRAELRKPELHYADGFYSYEAVRPETPGGFMSKSFFDVASPLIAGHHGNQWLIIRSAAIPAQSIHPEQARIELYIENTTRPERDLQELEMQFAYETIAPGASIEATETWEIFPAGNSADKNELRTELKKLLK